MSKAIISGKDQSIIPDDNNVKVLSIRKDEPDSNHMDFLVSVVQLFDIGRIVGKIEKGTEYVVQVPA